MHPLTKARLLSYCIGLLAAFLFFIATHAHAQVENCSQTVGTGSVAVPNLAGGRPMVWLRICNAHATNTLGVNAVGGDAAIGSAGTLTLPAGGCISWTRPPTVPSSVNVIGSASSTTTACEFQ